MLFSALFSVFRIQEFQEFSLSHMVSPKIKDKKVKKIRKEDLDELKYFIEKTLKNNRYFCVSWAPVIAKTIFTKFSNSKGLFLFKKHSFFSVLPLKLTQPTMKIRNY